MPIEFSCENCKKKIKAPDTAGGKYGKCPACGHRCYIPMPKQGDEPELKLAPIDESEETSYGKMMSETYSLTKHILHQTEIPKEDSPAGANEKQIIAGIVRYLRLMADGKVEAAEAAAKNIFIYKSSAREILDRMAVADSPEPELKDVPPKVIAGYIRQLRAKL